MPNRLSAFNRLSALRGAANIGPTKTVGTTDADYSTIAAAIADASSGDTILVSPGTYAESNLQIPSGVNLIGWGPSSIISATPGSSVGMIRPQGNNIISGLTIINSGSGYGIGSISDSGADTVTVDNCYVTAPNDCFYIKGTDWTIKNCHIVLVYDGVWCGGTITVQDCVFSGTPTVANGAALFVLTAATVNCSGCVGNLLCGDATGAQDFMVAKSGSGACAYTGIGNSWRYSANGYTPSVYYFRQLGTSTLTVNAINESFYSDVTAANQYLAYLSNTVNQLNYIRCRGLPTQTSGTTNAIINVQREMPEYVLLEETVDLTDAGAKFKALTQAIPQGAVIINVQANIDAAVTAGGTSTNVGLGLNGADPDQYGLSANLLKNTQINTLIAPGDQAALGGALTLEVCACNGAVGLGDSNFSAGTVRVRVLYQVLANIRTA